VTAKAGELGITVATPLIGESFELNGSPLPAEKWWEKVGSVAESQPSNKEQALR
jgi:hypothetical protein